MRLFDSDLVRSPWLIGFATGGGLGLIGFATDDGPLPLKLLLAVCGGMFAGMRSARRHGRKQLDRRRLVGERVAPIWDLPADHDFQAEIGRRAALPVAPPPDIVKPWPVATTTPGSEIDERCAALERSLAASDRKF